MTIHDGTKREANGQYALAKFDHMCKCGHTLGQHAAVRIAKTKDHPCFAGDDGAEPCDCTFFTKVKAPRALAK